MNDSRFIGNSAGYGGAVLIVMTISTEQYSMVGAISIYMSLNVHLSRITVRGDQEHFMLSLRNLK